MTPVNVALAVWFLLGCFFAGIYLAVLAAEVAAEPLRPGLRADPDEHRISAPTRSPLPQEVRHGR